MHRIAFATCSALPHGIEDDQPLAEIVNAEFQVWDDESVDWNAYDRVIVRSTWDYTGKLDDYLRSRPPCSSPAMRFRTTTSRS